MATHSLVISPIEVPVIRENTNLTRNIANTEVDLRCSALIFGVHPSSEAGHQGHGLHSGRYQ